MFVFRYVSGLGFAALLLVTPCRAAGEPRPVNGGTHIVTIPLAGVETAGQISGTASVLSADALLQLDADIRNSAIATEYSRKQLERNEALSKGKAISQQTAEGAERQAKSDEVAQAVLGRRLLQTWGEKAPFLKEDEREAIMAKLASGETSLVRLDIPENLESPPAQIRLQPLSGGKPKTVETFWTAPSGNLALPGVSYFALVPSAPGLRAGDRAIVTAERTLPEKGVLVPAAAIVLKSGAAWCFVEIEKGKFVRRAVELSHPAEGGYIVKDGLRAGEEVAVSGGALLLSREAAEAEHEDAKGGSEPNSEDHKDDKAPEQNEHETGGHEEPSGAH